MKLTLTYCGAGAWPLVLAVSQLFASEVPGEKPKDDLSQIQMAQLQRLVLRLALCQFVVWVAHVAGQKKWQRRQVVQTRHWQRLGFGLAPWEELLLVCWPVPGSTLVLPLAPRQLAV